MEVVLETLTPAERAAFVLHDVFGYRFDDVGVVLGRSVTGVRQLASRARRKVRREPEPPSEGISRSEKQQVVSAFLTSARGGDLSTLLYLLAPDVVMRADLVGRSIGSEAIFEGASKVAARFNGSRGAVPAIIDGELGAAWIQAGLTKVAFVYHLDGEGRITEVELIADPSTLAAMDIVRVRRTHQANAHS